jgi:hypothetical protein
MNITIYQEKKYRIGYDENDNCNLYSLNNELYPNLFGIKQSQLKNAYHTRIWVCIRGCEALYNGVIDGLVKLDVRPSIDVEILEANEVDRGVYHAQLPVSEIESMWEERMPYLDFPFPEGLATREELEIPK